MDNNGPKNLAKKLAEITAAVGSITKTGYNNFQNYSYAKESDILEAIRNELSSRGIFVFSSVANSHKEGDLTTVLVTYTFVDSETGEQFSVNGLGQGSDKQDKGVYKALTGANKYVFLKNFLLPTDDDPEATNSEGKSTASRAPAKVSTLKSASATSASSTTANKPSRFADRKKAGKG